MVKMSGNERKSIEKSQKYNREYKKYAAEQITRIIDVLSDVSMGDFDVCVKRYKNDEFGVLIIGINNMIKELKKMHAELEKKVEERTEELKLKNEELQRFNRFAVDRELKMVELKKRIAGLEKR